jgi:hypothetical protein
MTAKCPYNPSFCIRIMDTGATWKKIQPPRTWGVWWCLYFLGWFAVEMLRWTASEDLACAVRLVCKIFSVSSNDTTWCRRSDFHVMLVGYAMSEHLLREHEHPVQVQHSTSSWYWQPNLLKLRQWFQAKQNPVTACTTNKKILKTELRLPAPRPILKFTYTVSMFVCMQTCFVCPSVRLPVRPSARLPVCPSARMSVCPCVRLSIYLSSCHGPKNHGQ